MQIKDIKCPNILCKALAKHSSREFLAKLELVLSASKIKGTNLGENFRNSREKH